MSNLSKNLLLALSLISALALLAFFIHLIVINIGVEREILTIDVPARNELFTSSETNNIDEDSNSVTFTPAPVVTAPPTPTPTPPRNIIHQLTIFEDTILQITADENIFTFSESESEWWFTYAGHSIARLEITKYLLTAQGLEADATNFLGSYTGGLPVEFAGMQPMRGSEIIGYYVNAFDEYNRFEAWIHPFEGQNLALVFVISYSEEFQRDALYNLLSSARFQFTHQAPINGADLGDVDPESDDSSDTNDE